MASWNTWRLCERLMMTFLLILVMFGVQNVDGFHASGQCVQLGQANTNNKHANINNEVLKLSDRHGYWTIGTKKFDVKSVFLDNSLTKADAWTTKQDCPYGYDTSGGTNKLFFQLCPQDAVKISTYAVFQDGVIMNGWLHFEVELTAYSFMDSRHDEIMGIYVQIRDENFNAVGEFILNENEQCASNTPDLAVPSQYQVLPCSAVGRREAKTSNALFLAQKKFLQNETAGGPYLSKEEIGKGIHFTWRLSEYWCNRHLRIRPEAIIITNKMVIKNTYRDNKIYRKAADYWIFPGWFGAADIKKKNTRLDCSKKAIDYSTGKYEKKADGTNVASWFLEESKVKPLKSVLDNDYVAVKNLYDDKVVFMDGIKTIKSCHANTRWTLNNKQKVPSFAGRCISIHTKEPGHDILQACELDGKAAEFEHVPAFEAYTTYVQTLTVNRTNLCSVPCNAPTLDDLEAIKNYTDRSGESEYTVQTVFNTESRNEARVEKLWLGRKYHAVLCAIWTMFLCPVAIFLARYYKETAMDRMCSGIHAWWWVHVSTAVAAYCMFLSSIADIWSNLGTWGRSTHPWGYQYPVNGYTSMAALSLMILLGGFRAGRDLSRKLMRIAFMFMHSLCVFAIYFCNLFAIMMSTWIPASPSMDDCDDEGNSASNSTVLIMSIIWLVMDIAFHIVMTTLYLMVDRRVHITRPWYCPIVPIMPPDSTSDLPGASVRKIMFLVYLGASFIMMVVTVGFISSNELSDKCKNLTGPSDCEGDEIDRIYGCSSYVKAYLKFVAEATAINVTGTYNTP